MQLSRSIARIHITLALVVKCFDFCATSTLRCLQPRILQLVVSNEVLDDISTTRVCGGR